MQDPKTKTAGWLSSLRFALNSLKEYGVKEALLGARGYLDSLRLESREGFDRRHRTDTRQSVAVSDLGLSPEDAGRAKHYWPSLESSVREVLAAIPEKLSGFTFVDLGSGKGRTLLLACDYPFKEIVGVEVSPVLHRTAQENLDRVLAGSRRADVSLVCADAGTYSPPPRPTLFYLFDPFHEEVMARVLENLRASLEACPRTVYWAYSAPRLHDQIAASGLLEPVKWSMEVASGRFEWILYRSRPLETSPVRP